MYTRIKATFLSQRFICEDFLGYHALILLYNIRVVWIFIVYLDTDSLSVTPIYNGNKWSPIRSVIKQVIDKIDLSITSMIADGIGQHEVLLLINQNYDKI